jgi:hypothetical protein
MTRKQLNGWQRLWVFFLALWTIPVAMRAYSIWPDPQVVLSNIIIRDRDAVQQGRPIPFWDLHAVGGARLRESDRPRGTGTVYIAQVVDRPCDYQRRRSASRGSAALRVATSAWRRAIYVARRPLDGTRAADGAAARRPLRGTLSYRAELAKARGL